MIGAIVLLIGTLASLGLTAAQSIAESKRDANRVSLNDIYDIIRSAASEAAAKGANVLSQLESKILNLNLGAPSQNIKNIFARETARVKSLRNEVNELNAQISLNEALAQAESSAADETTSLTSLSKKEQDRINKSKEKLKAYETNIKEAKQKISDIEKKI